MKTAQDMQAQLQTQRENYEAETAAMAGALEKLWLDEIERRLELAFNSTSPCSEITVYSNALEGMYDFRMRSVFESAMLRSLDVVICKVMNRGFNAYHTKGMTSGVWSLQITWDESTD